MTTTKTRRAAVRAFTFALTALIESECCSWARSARAGAGGAKNRDRASRRIASAEVANSESIAMLESGTWHANSEQPHGEAALADGLRWPLGAALGPHHRPRLRRHHRHLLHPRARSVSIRSVTKYWVGADAAGATDWMRRGARNRFSRRLACSVVGTQTTQFARFFHLLGMSEIVCENLLFLF